MGVTAIFGGTFNPPHRGHYEMLECLQASDFIEKIWVMPDRIPPHKVCDFLASDDQRIDMCRILSSDFSKAELCLVEFERNGKSYSYDTVLLLKERHPGTCFSFVIGGDMLVSLEKWYRFDELKKEIPFIVFRRIDTDNTLLDERVAYFRGIGTDITVMPQDIADISSTYIRNNITESAELLPYTVYDYIVRENIYRE